MIWTHHSLTGLLAVHEAFRNGVRGEQLVAGSELLEYDSVRESLPADSDALQYTVTSIREREQNYRICRRQNL